VISLVGRFVAHIAAADGWPLGIVSTAVERRRVSISSHGSK